MNLKTEQSHRSAWQSLRRWTPARVALGRTGGSLPTDALLDFRLAHARARDALLRPLNEEHLLQSLIAAADSPILHLHSAAKSLDEFLRRPDLGRQLAPESIEQLQPFSGRQPDLAVLVSEGLSTLAVETHAGPVLQALLPRLRAEGWRLTPVCLARRARVALQDQVGELLAARIALILLGERPGLVSPDSLGAYLVYAPRRGNTDAQRNCVSNISALGLSASQAATKLHWLLTESCRRGLSGVPLKDESHPVRELRA